MPAEAFPPIDAIRPPIIRADVSTLCQLSCPCCPTAKGTNHATIGRGTMRAENFEGLLERHPELKHVEMGNWGEPLLNPELPRILELAHEAGVSCSIDEGTNFNMASDEVLEALVRFGCLRIRVAMDGATSASYRIYRQGGDLKTVIRNVRRLEAVKMRLGADRPHVLLQCVLFSHNQHEVDAMVFLARALGCDLYFKINWSMSYQPLRNPETLLDRIPATDRVHYVDETGHHYKRAQCRHLWNSPQISFDGRILGCARNVWRPWPGNAFRDAAESWMNSKELIRCREALMGRRPMAEDACCQHCAVWQSILDHDDWVTEEELVTHRFDEMDF